VAALVVERGMEAWDEDATQVACARLADAYWLIGGDVDCPGCRELLGGDCSVTTTGYGGRDDHLGQDTVLLARLEQARMVIVAVAAVTVVAALVLASG
jgi:hypothetical protein